MIRKILDLIEKAKGYRTLAINILTVAATAVALLTNNLNDPDQLKLAIMVLGGINFLLRLISNTPVGKKS